MKHRHRNLKTSSETSSSPKSSQTVLRGHNFTSICQCHYCTTLSIMMKMPFDIAVMVEFVSQLVCNAILSYQKSSLLDTELKCPATQQ